MAMDNATRRNVVIGGMVTKRQANDLGGGKERGENVSVMN